MAGRSSRGKIIKAVAMRSFHILKLCTKFDFGWGYAPTPLSEPTDSPESLAGFMGATSKGKGKTREGKREWVATSYYFRLKRCSVLLYLGT